GNITFASGSTFTNGTINAGALADFSRGSSLGGTITNDGTLDVSVLGSVSANVSGTGTVRGGTSSAVTWNGSLSGGHITGNITFAQGATLSGTITNDGTLDVSALGSVSANVSGTGTIQGGASSAVTWHGNLSGESIKGSFIIDGNIENITGFNCNIQLSSTAIIKGYLSLDDSSSIYGGLVSENSKIIITRKTKVSKLSLEAGGVIDFSDVDFSDGTSLEIQNGNILLIDPEKRIIWSGSVVDNDFHHYNIEKDVSGNLQVKYIPCFLAGAMILTKTGPVKVEDISVGDMVFAFEGTNKKLSKVTWVGKKDVIVNRNIEDDLSGFPICIKRNAISENVPCTDLLITSEHCVFIDNFLIPARMLVNGDTIFYDKSISNYTCYHFELENHSVVMANNMFTESLLKSPGHFFDDDRNIKYQTHDKFGCNIQPIVNTERSFVEKVYNKLLENTINTEDHREDYIFTQKESALCIKTKDEKFIYPSQKNNGVYKFKMPSNTGSFNLLSRSGRPCDHEGPFVDDRRHLGVLIERVSVFHSKGFFECDNFLKNTSAEGWNNIESNHHCRWTNGNAELTLSGEGIENDFVLALQVKESGPYKWGR
ncbi:Hint domain-containing protein, partial [Asaia spathodeae]|uniref:Hint domain-containing protein n=1 Tax=Asaia spathodeae TaxID=657016 RepID=UPI002FC305C9